MIDYKKLARHLEKNIGVYIHPNQIKRYINNHPTLESAKYEDVYRALHRYLLKYAAEIDPDM